MYKKLFSLTLCLSLVFGLFTSCRAAHLEESQGLKLSIPNEVFPLLHIETSLDPNNIFKISEFGSINAAKKTGANIYGAGWIFSISKVSENELYKILQEDASGMDLFAYKDNEYYFYNHPTDVRYIRENTDAMCRDQAVWTKVNEWGYNEVRKNLIKDNNLQPITADNSDIGIAIAKTIYNKNSNATLTSLAAGEFKIKNKDAEIYLKDLLYDTKWTMTNEEEPDGEYIILNLPNDKMMLKFFYAEGKKNYVSRVSEGSKPLVFKCESLNVRYSNTEVAKLYQFLADSKNKPTTFSGERFIGAWHESIAGRGSIDIKKSEDIYKISIIWGESAFATSFWNMTAKFKNGALYYEDCEYKTLKFNEKGVETVIPHYKNGSGNFKILVSGELIWNDGNGNAGEASVFLRD